MSQRGEISVIATDSIVSNLRQRKKETGLSLQDIADLTEQNGAAVSLTTVKRVFSEGASDFDFRYDTTLRPIAQALGLSLDPVLEEGSEEMQAALTMLKETYEARVADLWSAIKMLRRDKVILITIALGLLLFVFYLFADGLHGSWGFFRYPIA